MKRFLLTTLMLCSAAVMAAPQPTTGTFDGSAKALMFQGGPFIAPNLTSDRVYLGDSEGSPSLVCREETMNCDLFALTVNLPSNVRSRALQQKQVLRVALDVQERQPIPLIQPEFHLYVFDASGNLLAESENAIDGSLQKHVDLALQAVPNGHYSVVVTGYNGLGASYTATIATVAAK